MPITVRLTSAKPLEYEPIDFCLEPLPLPLATVAADYIARARAAWDAGRSPSCGRLILDDPRDPAATRPAPDLSGRFKAGRPIVVRSVLHPLDAPRMATPETDPAALAIGARPICPGSGRPALFDYCPACARPVAVTTAGVETH